MDFESLVADLPELTPKIVLGIAAHPDDLDFGASGTMAKFATEGADVHYLIVTDGSKGSPDDHLSTTALIKTRQAEQRAAAKAIGASSVIFLGYPDGELEVSMGLKRDIVKVIRSLKPDIVITMDPSMIYSASKGFINHPDHRAAGQATLDSVFPLARDHLSFPELASSGLMPHNTSTLLLINFDSQNYYVDITTSIQLKKRALKCHKSQISDFSETWSWVEGMAAYHGKKANTDFAESFLRIDIR